MSDSNGSDHGCGGCCPGPKGNDGPQGPQGLQGSAGPAGQPGQTGLQGNPGLPGPMGLTGDQGLQGVPGRDGQPGPLGNPGSQGQPGQNGLQGNMGLQGPQGLQGLPGLQGDCIECPCDCAAEFAEVYSQLSQNLAPSLGPNLAGQTVLLEQTIFATANIDISQAAANGKIMVNLAGWYDVSTGICGALNPIASPLPCWTLSLFKNGVYVPGSTFANQTISPEQKANEIVADVFVHFNKGDILELANTSSAMVVMAPPTLGTFAPASSAYLKIILLKAD